MNSVYSDILLVFSFFYFNRLCCVFIKRYKCLKAGLPSSLFHSNHEITTNLPESGRTQETASVSWDVAN